jgi:hypothetical protein
MPLMPAPLALRRRQRQLSLLTADELPPFSERWLADAALPPLMPLMERWRRRASSGAAYARCR